MYSVAGVFKSRQFSDGVFVFWGDVENVFSDGSNLSVRTNFTRMTEITSHTVTYRFRVHNRILCNGFGLRHFFSGFFDI